MTNDELDAIEARCEGLTGPAWSFEDDRCGKHHGWRVMAPDPRTPEEPWTVCEVDKYLPEDADGTKHAAFIAHARADVPALVAEVRRLRRVSLRALRIGPAGQTAVKVLLRAALGLLEGGE